MDSTTNITKTNLKRSITTRYIIALSLIAILSTIAFYSLHKVLEESEQTAYLVNISGKQRMLSQHLALDAHRLYDAKFKENNNLKISLYEGFIEKYSKEMLEANNILSSGKKFDKQIYKLSPTIKELYFGSTNLAKRVMSYNELILNLKSLENKDEYYSILKELSVLSETLLNDLNIVVLQYQKEGEEKIKLIKGIESFIWILTLFVLVLEILFIFQPMVRNIIELTNSKNKLLKTLQSEVEQRTIHLENANKKLSDMAYHDPLTGLKNRFSLEHDMEDLLKQYFEHHASYAVLLFDIDFFKKVNDTYGHDFGDFVLEEIAKIFTSSFRIGDKIYRTGGEEFIVLLNRISYEDTIKIAQKTLELVEKHPFTKGEITIYKTVSCGIFHSDICETSKYKEILKYADVALYEAKNTGRNKIQLYKKDYKELHPISYS